jgi:hypothetical protein
MLRAAARVRAAKEESAVRAEASRAQEGRAQEKERLAAEARAKAHKTMVAADVARLEADKQRAVRRRSWLPQSRGPRPRRRSRLRCRRGQFSG